MLVIIPCGGKKRAGKWPAFQLYCGSGFIAALKAALRLTTRENIRILSGKHGLLRLESVVEFYEQRIDEPGGVSAETVRRQASGEGLLGVPVVILAGKAYASVALQVWPHAQTPLSGARGMGYQRQILTRLGR